MDPCTLNMNLYLIPHVMATLTFLAINACFVLAASNGHIPWCFPYIEGCVSISKASRNLPEIQIYRFAMIASAILMVSYWTLCGNWIKQLYRELVSPGGQLTGNKRRRTFVTIGIISSICLAINALLIGNENEFLKELRQICVTTFFFGAILAQCIFALELKRLVVQNNLFQLNKMSNFKISLCIIQVLLAILAIVIAPYLNQKPYFENIAEWNIVLLMVAFFVSTGICWKQTHFQKLATNIPTAS